MTQTWLPPAEYYATLPKQIASAGVIFRNAEGRVLLVEPTYGAETWEIPGGGLDEGESPWAGARREIKEELGFDVLPGRLLGAGQLPQRCLHRPRRPHQRVRLRRRHFRIHPCGLLPPRQQQVFLETGFDVIRGEHRIADRQQFPGRSEQVSVEAHHHVVGGHRAVMAGAGEPVQESGDPVTQQGLLPSQLLLDAVHAHNPPHHASQRESARVYGALRLVIAGLTNDVSVAPGRSLDRRSGPRGDRGTGNGA
ncbi:NUDIX domain-containing protein [Amycolatopsis sp. lyj-23]|uniref:NUDIX domain-containing protein n=1 Tax=Amycolatopsis sp. lyj-23 TaxID=2789283 RepID=UPI00397B50BC